MKPKKYIKKIMLKLWLSLCKFFYLFHSDSKEIKLLKNKHIGEKVFIVATGPSLKISDLELLKNFKTISMNGIVNSFDKTSYRPDYYMIQDSVVLNRLYKRINDSDLNCVYVGKGNSYALPMNIEKKTSKLINKRKIYYSLNSNYHYFDMCYNEKKMKTNFSDNFSKQAFDGCTVTYSAIQFAMYLGFKEIYLIGCDSTYGGHFDDKSKEDNVAKPIYFKAYEKALEYACKHDIKIINCTRGGMLEVFPRKSLEEVVA